MLETIRQFAAEQLAATGAADRARTAHARYFADREADIMALWSSPRQREAHEWFAVELPNLRSAFRFAADTNKLDTAAPIAVLATFLGYYAEQYEPSTWAEELVEPARAVNHPRLAQLYMAASMCYMAGRTDDFLVYIAAAEDAVASGRFDAAPIELEATLGGGFLYSADAEQCIEWGRRLLARWPDHRYWVLPHWVFAFTFAGAHDEALAASEELFAAVDGMVNPALVTGALFAYGYTHRNRDPDAAYAALRRGLVIAQDNGLRQMESVLATTLSSVAASHTTATDALGYLALAIRTYYDSGSLSFVTGPLGILAVVLGRLQRYEQAATVSTFAEAAIALATYPEIGSAMAHIREVLGRDRYEMIARAGAEMTHAARAAYALDQIDRVCNELSDAGESG